MCIPLPLPPKATHDRVKYWRRSKQGKKDGGHFENFQPFISDLSTVEYSLDVLYSPLVSFKRLERLFWRKRLARRSVLEAQLGVMA